MVQIILNISVCFGSADADILCQRERTYTIYYPEIDRFGTTSHKRRHHLQRHFKYLRRCNSPVMLHRAILGSLERWIGMLIEHYAGAMPVWLSPFQVAVASITDDQVDYAKSVAQQMKAAGLRVTTDLRGEKINYKIRELTMQKHPYIAVVGDKEKQNGTVSIRARGGRNLGVMPVADFIARVADENARRLNKDE